jgi:hypothetical protein
MQYFGRSRRQYHPRPERADDAARADQVIEPRQLSARTLLHRIRTLKTAA